MDNQKYVFEKLEEVYVDLYKQQVIPQKNGLSVLVYTQFIVSEDEINGLIIYDRKIDKVFIEEVKEMNRLIKTFETSN